MRWISLRTIIVEAAQLFRRNGFWLYFDFLLAMVAVKTAAAVLEPKAVYGTMPKDWQEYMFGLLTSMDFAIYVVVQALVLVGVTARIWTREYGALADGIRWEAVFIPAVVLLALADYMTALLLWPLFLPAFFFVAMTCVLAPALIVEGLGWQSLKRSIELTQKSLLPLAALWLAEWLIVIIIAVVLAAPVPEPGSPYSLWSDILTGLWVPVTSGFSVCLMTAIYVYLIRAESGQADPEVFR